MRTRSFLVLPLAAALAACGTTTAATPSPTATSSPAASVAKAGAAAAPQLSAPAAKTSGFTAVGRTIVLDEIVNASTYTPAGKSAHPGGPTGTPAAGDVWSFSSLLTRNGKQTGTDHVVVTFAADGSAGIDAVETLADGRIVGHGTAPFEPTLAIPVISGTGTYAGAKGTITIVNQDNSHSTLTIALG